MSDQQYKDLERSWEHFVEIFHGPQGTGRDKTASANPGPNPYLDALMAGTGRGKTANLGDLTRSRRVRKTAKVNWGKYLTDNAVIEGSVGATLGGIGGQYGGAKIEEGITGDDASVYLGPGGNIGGLAGSVLGGIAGIGGGRALRGRHVRRIRDAWAEAAANPYNDDVYKVLLDDVDPEDIYAGLAPFGVGASKATHLNKTAFSLPWKEKGLLERVNPFSEDSRALPQAGYTAAIGAGVGGLGAGGLGLHAANSAAKLKKVPISTVLRSSWKLPLGLAAAGVGIGGAAGAIGGGASGTMSDALNLDRDSPIRSGALGGGAAGAAAGGIAGALGGGGGIKQRLLKGVAGGLGYGALGGVAGAGAGAFMGKE